MSSRSPTTKFLRKCSKSYYDAHPQNLITVEKGREFPGDAPGNNVYSRAAAAFKEWEAKNVIAQDAAPSFYAYTQEFTCPAPRNAARAEDSSARPARGIFRRRDFPPRAHALRPKADRLELLRNTRTHTGQLFMLYSDPQKRADAILAEAESAAPPATEVHDEYGVTHRLWVVSDTQKASRFSPRWRTRSSSLPTAITVTKPRSTIATSVAQKRVSPIHTRHTKMR